MNALELLLERDIHPSQLAFFELGTRPVSYGELLDSARRAQKSLRGLGFSESSSILLADSISADFYAVVMAALGLGGKVILVEPFLPVREIEQVISVCRPSVFVASFLGRAWGARVSAIRDIPHWKSSKSLCNETGMVRDFCVSDLPPETPGIITFTTGTSTGRSKGVVRTHQGLTAQNRAIRTSAELELFRGPDLAIFANLTLANLGMGRGTVFIPPGWKAKHFKQLADLPKELKPETLSCGPTFLKILLSRNSVPETLRSVHVGGALTECSLFESAFDALPESRFIHVYGSSEAEPVAFVDAKESVRKSKERGFVHALLAGNIVPGLMTRMDDRTLWVSGDHVCGEYLGNAEENLRSKEKDPNGRLWHAMGDRMVKNEDGLWYQGRSFQDPDDFLLEQKIYRVLGHTKAFVFRDKQNLPVLSGESLKTRSGELLRKFPQISRVQEKKIIRDRRHRARIDRGASQ